MSQHMPLGSERSSQAHAALDAAVAAAYGWPEDPSSLSDDEILRHLLALNRQRAAPPM